MSKQEITQERVKENLIGLRFGRWTVIEMAGRYHVRNRLMWLCFCDCGNRKTVVGDSLRSGASQSCGCLQKKRTGDAARTHGATGSAEHNIWNNMKQRCSNPRNPDYHSYGGRGISVCLSWERSFASFLLDMGFRPGGRSIDRIDNDGDYTPKNCRWATPGQQAMNTRRVVLIECEGGKMPVTMAARISGLNRDTVFSRIRRGWSGKDLLLPTRRINA